MEKILYKVEGMSCGHCVKAVTEAVNELSGVGTVRVELNDGTVLAEYDSAMVSPDQIKAAIVDAGYDVVG